MEIRRFPPRTLLLRAVHFKGDFVTDVYGWLCGGGALIYRTVIPCFRPFPSLPITPPTRLLAPGQRSPFRVQSEALLWLVDFWEKDLMARLTGL